MKVSEFIGKKVLDKNAMEIGKISDIDLTPMEGIVNSITVSTGGLRNRDFEIKPNDIHRIGDYMILKFEGDSVVEVGEKQKKRLTL